MLIFIFIVDLSYSTYSSNNNFRTNFHIKTYIRHNNNSNSNNANSIYTLTTFF